MNWWKPVVASYGKAKRGYIADNLPPILERLSLEPEGFIQLMKR
ncbi:hypothetical protein [Pleionea mediterranea]|nr:hypothetical protein [Pleionea mediterranea]